MKDAYQRRRAKARVEKTARMRRLDVVTLEFAKTVIEEETGVEIGDRHALPLQDDGNDGPKLIARDEKNVPLTSHLDWAPDAVQRVLRVPSGFMRNRTQERIESLARERSLSTIDLALVEEGIAVGRKMMEEAIAGYQKAPEQARAGYNAIDVTRSDAPTSLNEVGVMSEMARLRAKS